MSHDITNPTPTSWGGWRGAEFASSGAPDWYSATVTKVGLACSQLETTATVWTDATLARRGGSSVTTSVKPYSSPTRLSLAGVGGDVDLFGLQPASAGDDQYYAFHASQFGFVDLGAGDGASGRDSTTASPVAVPGGCIAGHLDSIGLDVSDVYTFTATSAQDVVYSLSSQSGGVTLALYDASGNPIGPSIVTGGIAIATLPSAGSYSLTTSSASVSATDYIIGLVGPDPPGGGCRPACRVSTSG